MGPFDNKRIVLCSADAGPKSQKDTPDQAGYFYHGAKWVGAMRNAAYRLGCRFVILTTAYGIVNPDTVIEPYDIPAWDNLKLLSADWYKSFRHILGENQYDIMVVHYGGCPEDPSFPVIKRILNEMGISVIKFGRPNMFDIGKVDDLVRLLLKPAGTNIDEIRSILKYPWYLNYSFINK